MSLKNYIKTLNWRSRVFFLVLLLLFAYLLSLSLGPQQKLMELHSYALADSVYANKYKKAWNNSELSDLVRRNTYLNALVELSEKDSIHLVADLVDSTLSLYISGVKIHEAPLSRIEQDRMFRKVSTFDYMKVFSSPLDVKEQVATIVKEPVVVREAPKDTLEASLNAWKPDTLIQKPAFARFRLQHSIDLIVEQEQVSVSREKWTRFAFHVSLGVKNTAKSLARFFTFRKQDYSAEIKVYTSAEDLRAIYRALPEKSSIVLNLRYE